jgi:Gpi18-like mannosyltransferase
MSAERKESMATFAIFLIVMSASIALLSGIWLQTGNIPPFISHELAKVVCMLGTFFFALGVLIRYVARRE